MLSGMDIGKTELERAFELARSGKCLSVEEIARHLHSEGYDISSLEDQTLKKQLKLLMEEAKKPHA